MSKMNKKGKTLEELLALIPGADGTLKPARNV
jgi:hypothetical protein